MPADRSTLSPANVHRLLRSRSRGFITRIYAVHHSRRFEWLRSKIASLGKRDLSVIELGCNDARSVEYIPVRLKRYLGLDAGWRSGWKDAEPHGLDAAMVRFRDRPHFEVHRSQHCEDLERVDETFDVAIVLETFEYLEPSELEAYVFALSKRLNDTGCIFATMPNEKGLPLLIKTLGSRLSGVPPGGYTPVQFCNALLGRLDKVPRAVRGRKGFNYADMAEIIGRYFPHGFLESVEPANAPLWMSLNVGLVAFKTIPGSQAAKAQADHHLAGGIVCT